MPIIALIIGIVVLITAYNDSAGNLGAALKQDLPGFFPWLMAIAAIMGLGYLPGMEKPSRYLLLLVAAVLILTKGQGIFAGFQSFMTSGGSATAAGSPPPEPTTAYAGGTGTPTQAEISGTGSAGPTPGQTAVAQTLSPQNYGPAASTAPATSAANPPDPVFAGIAALSPALAGFSSSIGFGGIA
jgi:hypothetical protein